MRDTAESTAPTLAAQRRDAEALSTPVLADIIRTAWYGVAVLDAQRRYLYVNPAGCRLLGSILSDLTGSVSPFPLERRNAGEDSIVPEDHHTPVMIEVEGTERVLDFTENGFGTGAERRSAVTFWDISKAQLLERRLAAFARTSSTLAYQGSLQVVLDGVATDAFHTCAHVEHDAEADRDAFGSEIGDSLELLVFVDAKIFFLEPGDEAAVEIGDGGGHVHQFDATAEPETIFLTGRIG